MRRNGLPIAVILSPAMLGACFGGGRVVPTDAATLARVRSVCLASFGSSEDADLIREKVRFRLGGTGRFAVVESCDGADAVLTGAAGVDRRNTNGNTRYRGTGLLRLVDRRTGRTIWAHQYKPGYSLKGATSRVADQMVEELLKDAGTPTP